MSLAEMPQDQKFTQAEIDWLKARNRVDEIRENGKLFPDAASTEAASKPPAHKAAPKERRAAE